MPQARLEGGVQLDGLCNSVEVALSAVGVVPLLAIDHSLVLLLLGNSCRSNGLHHKAEEGVVRCVGEKCPELTGVLMEVV